MAVAFVCVAVGIALGRHAWGWNPVVWFGAGALLAGIAAISKGRLSLTAIALATILLAAGWTTQRLHTPSPTRLDVQLGVTHADRALDTPTLITVEGLVLDTPEYRPSPREGLQRFTHREAVLRFPIRVDHIVGPEQTHPATGRLWIRVRAAHDPALIHAGQRIRVTGQFSPPGPPTNPGETDMRLWAHQEGVVGTLSFTGTQLIEPAAPPNSLLQQTHAASIKALATLRDRARAVLTLAAGDRPGSEADALVRGLILGDSDADQQEIQSSFARQGLAHILAISGFHLIVLARLTLSLVRLTGERGWLEPAIVGTLVLIYTCIVPAGSPIIRSTAMVLALLIAQGLGRRYDRLTLLGWIAIGLLIWRPLDLWSLGYQLSVGLTAMLFWAGRPFHDALFPPPLKGIVRPAPKGTTRELLQSTARVIVVTLKESLSTSAMCWLTALPTVLLRVGVLSPLGILASVIVTPVIVCVLWVGYLALFVGLLVPGVAGIAAKVLGTLAQASVRIVAWFDALPWSSVPLPGVSAIWALAATVVVATLARVGGWRTPRALALLAIILAWTVGNMIAADRLPAAVALRVDTFDVGSGTCHLVRSGQDALLWDAGPMGYGVFPAGVRAVRSLNCWRVPRLVITHPDTDHFAGLEPLLRPLGIREALVGERFLQQASDEPRGAAAAAIEILRTHGIRILTLRAGDTLAFGEGSLRFLSPPPRDSQDSSAVLTSERDNDYSLVGEFSVRVRAENNQEGILTALFTGDIEDQAIRALAQREPGLNPTILELPHHGSARTAAIGWTAQLDPAIVLQSTDRRRLNDPRWAGVREGRHWLCTAERGAVWAEILRNGTVRTGEMITPTTSQSTPPPD